MSVQALQCKECAQTYPLDARYVCEQLLRPARGRVRPLGARPRLDQAQDPGRSAVDLALRGLPAVRVAAAAGPAGRADAASGARRGWPSGSASARSGSRTTPPTPRTRSRTAWWRWPWRRPQELGYEVVACASTGNLANAVAAHAAAAGLESYVFIPADLEEQKVLATGVYGTHLVAVRGSYDDVNRLCTELSARARVGVRQRERAAVLRRGLEDARRSRSPSSSGSSCRIAWWRRWRRARSSRRSPAGSRSGSSWAWSRASCRPSTARRPPAARPWPRPSSRRGRLPAGQAEHDRQVARHRQPGRRPVRARSGAALGRLGRVRDRPGDPRRHPAARRDHRHLHRDRRRRDHRRAPEAGRAGCHRSRTSGWSS